MTVQLSPAPVFQGSGFGGLPLPGGQLFTYQAGTTTPQATFTDSTGLIQNTNPVILNANGQANVWMTQGLSYKLILKDFFGNQIWSVDNIFGGLPVTTALIISVINSTVNQAFIGAALYPQTSAESSLGITPTNFAYPEGDIRRYGATTASTNNSAFINSALSVSSSGGNAVFVPGGKWLNTSALLALPGCSMYGAGTSSVLVFSTGTDGIQFTTSDPGLIPRSRFFQDFQIQGTLSGTTNAAHGIFINTTAVVDVLFSNLSILNFQFGVFSTNLYNSTFFKCFIQNCYQGIYFNNQSITIHILDCVIQLVSSGTLITGPGTSVGISCQGAPEIEDLKIQGGSIYGYNYNINFGLIFECQIEHVDISFATICPIFFTSVLGPLVIRDCWIELASTASGTWNTGGTGTGNLTGIFVTALTPTTSAKVNIQGNYINSDVTIVGSTGVYLGNSNNGLTFKDNHIIGFDVGIGGGNTLNNPGGTSNGQSIVNNTINATTNSILMGSSSTELELGPNYIVSGGQVAFTSTPPASMRYTQPNVPMKGTAAFSSATTVAVAFTNNMPFSQYLVALSGNAAGFCWVTSKANSGFTINCSVSNSNAIDWQIVA